MRPPPWARTVAAAPFAGGRRLRAGVGTIGDARGPVGRVRLPDASRAGDSTNGIEFGAQHRIESVTAPFSSPVAHLARG